MPKIRNIIIFIAIAVALILIYVFFVKPSSDNQAGLVSSTPITTQTGTNNAGVAVVPNGTPLAAGDFLALLLNVKSIKLNDAIFSDPAFNGLHDSSITLVPDVTTGRPNPFAQFGNDTVQTTTTTTTPAAIPSSPTPSVKTPTVTTPTKTPTITVPVKAPVITPMNPTPIIP
jgi:hypothetical protein